MLVLDTDHFSELQRGSPPGQRLAKRLASTSLEKTLTIISVEESMRGWLAEISRRRDPCDQITAYAKLQRQVEVFADWVILPWNLESAEQFLELRRQGMRIGSMDLKIACIAHTHGATLLTRNATDFAQVPHLQMENWLD